MKEIKLTQGKVALVDDEDYERLVAMGKWQFNSKGYADKQIYLPRDENNKQVHKSISMHIFIFGKKKGFEIDHRDLDKLNNQKYNLRHCTQSENKKNRAKLKNNKSGFKGVCWHKGNKKWFAQLMSDRKPIYIGLFTCPIEAARAYNAAALIHHGEFARLNEIPA